MHRCVTTRRNARARWGCASRSEPVEQALRASCSAEMNRSIGFRTHVLDDREKFANAEPLRFNYGERLRIVLVNDTMMTHPIHLHGYQFRITATDGGRTRRSAACASSVPT